jgi:transcriptional regulator with GAF, ATPase, and Fis domain
VNAARTLPEGAARPVAASPTAPRGTAFEALVASISTRLTDAGGPAVDEDVALVLGEILRAFDGGRCELLIADEAGGLTRVAAASSAALPPIADDVDPSSALPWTRQRLLVAREPVILSSTRDLPADASTDRATFLALATRSLLAVPVASGTSRTYLLVLHGQREPRDWQAHDSVGLRVCGHLLAHALERRRAAESCAGAERRLREAHEQLDDALAEVGRLRQQLQVEQQRPRIEWSSPPSLANVVGRSAAIRRVLALVDQVAPTNATVLLTGETGTGKERFATLIHESSPRRKRTMVRVNCSAIPTALIESELFGREKGAYTGALSRQVGRFEVANGSTLFLDEIGDLPLDVQVKLLRVLQERTIERLGSPRPVDVDVRIIAATNRNLAQAVADGTFRSDLYYRLNVFPIDVPPLRGRREDIPALVAALVDEIGEAMGKRFDGVARESLEALQRYAWPGNVRELRNVLERTMILSPGSTLRVDVAAAPALFAHAGPESAASSRLDDVERDHIVRVLEQVRWRIKGAGSASARLGMKPSTLYFRMKKLGIVRPI